VTRVLRCPVAFARWDPLRDLLAIQQRLHRYAPGQNGWTPPVDVHETTEAFVLTAELPGVLEADIQVHTADNAVTITGFRRERPAACEQYHRLERGQGEFARTFELPVPIAGDAIVARLEDGVLTVSCPKQPAQGPVPARRVPVS
jgi:HSP20 family protein